MFSWRRIIACLMILVFAPASVLAAMPLRICVESDGSQIVEFDFAPCLSIVAERSAKETLPSFDSGQLDQFASHPGCHDFPILPATGKPAGEASFKKKLDLSKSLGAGLAITPQSQVAFSYCGSHTCSHSAEAGNRRHPNLATLATVVLRI